MPVLGRAYVGAWTPDAHAAVAKVPVRYTGAALAGSLAFGETQHHRVTAATGDVMDPQPHRVDGHTFQVRSEPEWLETKLATEGIYDVRG